MSEEIDEGLEQVMQHGLTLAAQIGREMSQAWRTHLEHSRRLNERQAQMVRSAFQAEQQTAAATLSATHQGQWWDAASTRDVLDAYRLANAWSEHDARAAQTEQMIRRQAQQRYGIDAARLVDDASAHAELIRDTPPERLAAAQQWAERTGWQSEIPSYYPEAQQRYNLLTDYDRAISAAQRAEGIGNGLTGEEDRQLGARDEDLNEGAELRDRAIEPAPEDLEEARAWVAEEGLGGGDPAQTEEAAREALSEERGPGDPQLRESAIESEDRAEKHELVGAVAGMDAAAAYNDAGRLRSEAENMRAAGVPERAIAAKQFGQQQQKFSPDHAAAVGKNPKKVRAGKPELNKAREKRRGLSR